MGNQTLMQLAGEQPDAVGPRVVAEEMAGHADLVAAAVVEKLVIEPQPVLDRLEAGGLQLGNVDRHHGDFYGGATDSSGSGFCRLRPMHDAGKKPPSIAIIGAPGSRRTTRRG